MQNNTIITLIAADDHQLFLEGLNSLFSQMAGLELLCTCNDGTSLVTLACQHQPDIVLLDLSMPGTKTEDIIATLEQNQPHIKTVALTMCFDYQKAQHLLSLGLSGYVLKDEAFHELESAIRQVYTGDEFISSSLIQVIRESDQANTEVLTTREKDILTDVAKGYNNQRIADSYFITERTVRFHIANCCVKLDASGRTNAVAKALSQQLINI